MDEARHEELKARLSLVEPGTNMLCSYPRSGSIWLRHLLFDINWLATGHWFLRAGQPKRMHRFTPQLEVPNFPRNYADSNFDWRVIKTHLPRGRIAPLMRKGRGVVLLRKPEDCFVSAYRKRLNEGFRPNQLNTEADDDRIRKLREMGVDAYALFLVDGWIKYVEGYLDFRRNNPDRILFALYENLRKDPIAELDRIVRFYGRDVKSSWLKRAVRNRDISRVKKAARTYGKINISRGAVGDAESTLSADTIEEIRHRTADRFAEVQQLAAAEAEPVTKGSINHE